MLLIPCPYCGPREESEFRYGGPARGLPPLDAPTQVAQHALFHPVNPRGVMRELWYHASGCERWITLHRDTATHSFEEGAT